MNTNRWRSKQTKYISALTLLRRGACVRGTLGFIWIVKGFRIKVTRRNLYRYYPQLMDDPSRLMYMFPHGGWYRVMERFRWEPVVYTVKEFADAFLELTYKGRIE